MSIGDNNALLDAAASMARLAQPVLQADIMRILGRKGDMVDFGGPDVLWAVNQLMAERRAESAPDLRDRVAALERKMAILMPDKSDDI